MGEFYYISEQKVGENLYALAKNKYGIWLVEKLPNQKAKPYFLGLTQNIFLKLPEAKNFDFIKENAVKPPSAIVITERLSKYPIVPKYTLVKDGLEFSINLNEIKKDSDNDGFNDFFEDFVGLNPNSIDTDNDGIDDFNDANPRFKSESSKFSQMYEAIADVQGEKQQYSFTEVLTDCEDFQKINPKNQKFLFYNTEEKLKLKDDVLDQFFPVKYSKIQRPKNKNANEIYFMDFGDQNGDGNLSAEFINGKWKITKQYNLKFGV